MSSGFALTTANSADVVAAYSAPKTVITAVASGTGWNVIGEFYLPLTVTAQLDVVGLVSDADLTMTARLWSVADKAAVTTLGTVATSSTSAVRLLSARNSLTGDRRYQIQAQVVGSSGLDQFGVVETATITGNG